MKGNPMNTVKADELRAGACELYLRFVRSHPDPDAWGYDGDAIMFLAKQIDLLRAELTRPSGVPIAKEG